eukprot:8196162-Pyramimonas_sp.AAC.1
MSLYMPCNPRASLWPCLAAATPEISSQVAAQENCMNHNTFPSQGLRGGGRAGMMNASGNRLTGNLQILGLQGESGVGQALGHVLPDLAMRALG